MKWYQEPAAVLIVLLVILPALGMSSCNASAATLPSETTQITTTIQTKNTTESTITTTTVKETTAYIEIIPTETKISTAEATAAT